MPQCQHLNIVPRQAAAGDATRMFPLHATHHPTHNITELLWGLGYMRTEGMAVAAAAIVGVVPLQSPRHHKGQECISHRNKNAVTVTQATAQTCHCRGKTASVLVHPATAGQTPGRMPDRSECDGLRKSFQPQAFWYHPLTPQTPGSAGVTGQRSKDRTKTSPHLCSAAQPPQTPRRPQKWREHERKAALPHDPHTTNNRYQHKADPSPEKEYPGRQTHGRDFTFGFGEHSRSGCCTLQQ